MMISRFEDNILSRYENERTFPKGKLIHSLDEKVYNSSTNFVTGKLYSCPPLLLTEVKRLY